MTGMSKFLKIAAGVAALFGCREQPVDGAAKGGQATARSLNDAPQISGDDQAFAGVVGDEISRDYKKIAASCFEWLPARISEKRKFSGYFDDRFRLQVFNAATMFASAHGKFEFIEYRLQPTDRDPGLGRGNFIRLTVSPAGDSRCAIFAEEEPRFRSPDWLPSGHCIGLEFLDQPTSTIVRQPVDKFLAQNELRLTYRGTEVIDRTDGARLGGETKLLIYRRSGDGVAAEFSCSTDEVQVIEEIAGR